MDLRTAVAEALDDDELFGATGACPTLSEVTGSRLVIVTGANAGGKSLFARLVASCLHDERVEVIRLSMGMRTDPGMVRGLMYGSEGRESTGHTSARTVGMALKTAAERSHANVVSLDEPDLGLSEGYQAAVGDRIAAFVKVWPSATSGLLLVTHSRAMVGRLLDLDPWCIRVGDDLRPTRRWLVEGEPARSLEQLDGLREVAHARRSAVQAVLNARAEERNSRRGP